MATYLYGLTLSADATHSPPSLAGLEGAHVRVLTSGALAAVVSTVRSAPRRALETVKAHDHVLRTLVDAGATVAAVRFGQVFPGDAEVCAEVDTRGSSTLAALRAHAGCVEMRLLLPDREVEPPAGHHAERPEVGPGTAYLETLRPRRAAPAHLRLRQAFGPVVRAERVESTPGPNASTVWVFAHLVGRADLGSYRETIATLPALSNATVVGPLPLYSFGGAE